MEESEEKPPPAARAQSAASLGDRFVPSWPWPFQWSLLQALSYVSPRAGAAQRSRMAESGEDAGRSRRGHKGFSRELGLLRSRRKTAQRARREKTEEEDRETPTPPRSCPCHSWTLTGAVPKPQDIRAPKASRFELGSRCLFSMGRAPGAVSGCKLAA